MLRSTEIQPVFFRFVFPLLVCSSAHLRARRWAIFFSPCCPHGSLPEFTWPRCPRGSLLLPRPSLPGRLAARCPRGWLSPESPPGRALASRPRSSLVHLTTRTCSPLGRLATHARPRGRVRLPSACHVAIAHLRARRWAAWRKKNCPPARAQVGSMEKKK